MPPKRVVKIEPSSNGAPPSKRPKLAVAVKKEQAAAAAVDDDNEKEDLKERFILLFSEEQYKDGISNSQLRTIFGSEQTTKLVPIINELSQKSRITMSMLDNKELFYKLVSEEVASKFAGLDPSARLV